MNKPTTEITKTYSCSCDDWNKYAQRFGSTPMKSFTFCPWCGKKMTCKTTTRYNYERMIGVEAL